MKKSLLVFLGISNLLLASEFDYGSGTFTMKGGFLGLTQDIDTDVTTYSVVTRHANLFSDAFYGYDITWYDSKRLNQAAANYNNKASELNNFLGNSNIGALSIPSMDYRLQGLDANVQLGYDLLHQDKDNYLGVGALVGISLPWIDGGKSDSSANLDTSILGAFPDTKTEIKTYKLGATVNFKKALVSDKLSLYGTLSYAYQTGNIENDHLNSDYSVDGTFQEYNLGLYFTPFTEEYKLGFLTLGPRVFATAGYKFSKWEVDKMSINMSGKEVSSDILSPLATQFSMESSIGYFGLGYSF